MGTPREKWLKEFINSDATIEDVVSGKFKMSYEALEESYFKACKWIKELVTENNELKEENKKLKEKIEKLEHMRKTDAEYIKKLQS